MNTKIAIAAVFLLYGSFSQAGFECKQSAGQVRVMAVHDGAISSSESKSGKLTITTSEFDMVELDAQIKNIPTRVGGRYIYKLPIESISFSISEFTSLITNPGCRPGRRMTCDYEWSSSYVGYLTFNGKSYELSCQVI